MDAPTLSTALGPERSEPSPELVAILDRQVGYDARTRQGLSNHLPMELVALDALGAPPSRLDAMFDEWVSRRLRLREDPSVAEAFAAEVAADGIDATVADHLPRLSLSPSSEWFHSMIRLAYALDVRHPAQVASALADWATYGRTLPGEPPSGGSTTAIEVLRRLHAAGLPPGDGHADLSSVARRSNFAELVADVVVDDDLDDVARAVAVAHVGGGDLATLHLVTGVHAARVVGQALGDVDRRTFARRVVHAALAAYVAAGSAPLPGDDDLDRLRRSEVPRRDEVRAAAVASPDVHVTKLVYTCRAEGTASGDALYAWLAARQVGLAGRRGVTGPGGR